MKKVHVFGDSHVGVLGLGWVAIAPDFEPLPFGLEFNARNGANWFEFETSERNGNLHFYSDRVRETLNVPELPVNYVTGSVDDVYVFSSPLHSCTVYRDATWHKFCPWECAAANPDLQVVSTSAIEFWASAQILCRLEMLRSMKDRGYNVAVVEPPKPLATTPAMVGLRPDVLTTTDRIYRNFVIRQLAFLDVPTIAAPSHTYLDGLTIAEYAAPEPDPHHGSVQFGAEMMKQIVAFARQTSGPACPACSVSEGLFQN